jgi:hypothetical protein
MMVFPNLLPPLSYSRKQPSGIRSLLLSVVTRSVITVLLFSHDQSSRLAESNASPRVARLVPFA